MEIENLFKTKIEQIAKDVHCSKLPDSQKQMILGLLRAFGKGEITQEQMIENLSMFDRSLKGFDFSVNSVAYENQMIKGLLNYIIIEKKPDFIAKLKESFDSDDIEKIMTVFTGVFQ